MSLRTEDHPNVRPAVGFAKVLLWVCAGLMAVLVILSCATPGLRDESSFLLLGGVAVVPLMVCSAFLLWRELRANRRELRAARRESRDIPFEEGPEWTSKVWFYVLVLSGWGFLEVPMAPRRPGPWGLLMRIFRRRVRACYKLVGQGR